MIPPRYRGHHHQRLPLLALPAGSPEGLRYGAPMDRALTIISLVVACLALAWAAKTNARLDDLSGSTTEAAAAREVPTPEPEGAAASPAEPTVELADLMRALALRMSNLWYARAAGDMALFDYEVREIEEIQEELKAAGLTEAGRDVDAEVERLVLKPLPALRESLAGGDQEAYEKRYLRIVAGCNECHQATAHPFIRITAPTAPQVGNRSIGPGVIEAPVP